jgi:broad specificity phosphatase PhoE
MLPKIHLIRHGETEWSRTGQHTSRTDLPLTAAGEDEARALGRRLQGIIFTQVLSSPRQRARQTCVLAGLVETPVIDDGLCEWDYGRFEGLRSAEIQELQPGWNLFRDGSPGGETPLAMTARVDAVVARLRTMTGNVAVVSHGHLLRVLAARWGKLPIEAAQRLYLNTASLSLLGFEHDRAGEPVILLWNERSG